MKLDLSNTELRAYKKKNNKISLNLRARLLVITGGVTFSFTGYLKEMQCWITLPDQEKVEAKSISISVSCYYSEDIMIHNLYVKFEIPDQKLETSIAKLRFIFHISFTGHPYEKPTYINKKAVIVPIHTTSWL